MKKDSAPEAKAVSEGVTALTTPWLASPCRMGEGTQPQQEQGGSPWEEVWPVEPECTFPKNEELAKERAAGTALYLSGKGKLSGWLLVQRHGGQQLNH